MEHTLYTRLTGKAYTTTAEIYSTGHRLSKTGFIHIKVPEVVMTRLLYEIYCCSSSFLCRKALRYVTLYRLKLNEHDDITPKAHEKKR